MSGTPRAGASQPSSYAILGIKSTSTDDEIKTAYKKKVVEVHPDKPGGTPQKFRVVQKAYDSIKTSELRRKYNLEKNSEKKLKNYSSIRPQPWSYRVKHPMQYNLMDGIPYSFETAPEKMRSKYRHGDVVKGPSGDQGVIVGVATDGIYWMKAAEPYASLLFSPDFGGDRDVALLFRDSKNPQGTRVYGNTSRMTQSQRDKQMRTDIAEKAKKRRCGEHLRSLVLDEEETRHRIESAVELYFAECVDSMKAWKARRCTAVPVLATGAGVQLRWAKAPDTPPPAARAPTVDSPTRPDVAMLDLAGVNKHNLHQGSSREDCSDATAEGYPSNLNGSVSGAYSYTRTDSGSGTPDSVGGSNLASTTSTGLPTAGATTEKKRATTTSHRPRSASGMSSTSATGGGVDPNAPTYSPNRKSFGNTYTGPVNGGASASFRSSAPRLVNTEKPFSSIAHGEATDSNASGSSTPQKTSSFRRAAAGAQQQPNTARGTAPKVAGQYRSTTPKVARGTTLNTSMASPTKGGAGGNASPKPVNGSGRSREPTTVAFNQEASSGASKPRSHSSVVSGSRKGLQDLESNKPISRLSSKAPPTTSASPSASSRAHTPAMWHSEVRAAQRPRATTPGPTSRYGLTERRSDLQKALAEAKKLRER